MDKEKLTEYLNDGLTNKQIGDIVGMSKSNVGYWITKLGLTELQIGAKHSYIDENMFNKIDTKEKAYIIGYALADVYITSDTVEFGCAIADRELLDFISSYIGCKVRIDNSYIPEVRRFPRARMSIGNKSIVTDFNKHCSSKEQKHCPIITKELERYLVQGFFDGEGCITWGFRKDRNRLWHKVSFTSSLKVLTGIQNILLKQCNISTVIRPKGKEKVFILEFANKQDIKKFINFIYPDDSFVVLKRKYNKANALRLELGEFGEDPRTPSEATEEIVVERVETSSCGNNKTTIAPELSNK